MSNNFSWTDIPEVDIQNVNQAISDDYDKLNAKNVVKAIRDLEPLDLLTVSIHEYNTKRRKTVLYAVHSKLLESDKALTLFNNYANLNAQDTIKAIRDLELYELLLFLMYEYNTKHRKTVLSNVQNKLSNNPDALAFIERFQREAQEGFTILQVGETGVGKSATINSLFGEEVAKTNKFTAQTREVTPFEGTYNGVKYTIYDTPGLGEGSNGNLQLDELYLSLMKDQCSAPDVLWYVLRLDDNRVTEGDFKILQLIRQYFGDAIWDRTMIVFTHSDRLTQQEEFKKSLEGRTKTINDAITKTTEGIVKGIPAVAVANGHELTPDGNSWLGELFTTSFEQLNPERQNAFFLAFKKDLKLPERSPLVPETQRPEANIKEEITEKTGALEKRIELTQNQVERVNQKSNGVSNIISYALRGAEIGGLFEGATGGATMGISIIIGAVIGGGIAVLNELSRDE